MRLLSDGSIIDYVLDPARGRRFFKEILSAEGYARAYLTNDVVDLYRTGMSLRAIGPRLGVHPSRVHTLLKESGTARRSPTETQKGRRKVSPELAAEMRTRHEEFGGPTLAELVKEFGLGKNTVSAAIVEAGGVVRMSRPATERVWRRVSIGDPTECWPYSGAKTANGYGHMNGAKGETRAHCAAWMYAHGVEKQPPGMHVMHLCDNPPCCNPFHLRLGTPQENVQDAERKGRRGPRGFTKQDGDRIREQYSQGRSQVSLAQEWNTSQTTICNIVNGRTLMGRPRSRRSN